jgi:hypothetical protein
MCLRHGQSAALVSLCVLAAFLPWPLWSRAVLFGVGAALKYSMLTLLAPALFARGAVLLCVAGFAVFAAAGLSPILFGNDLVGLYQQYLRELGSQTGSGFNTFAVSGYNMLQLDCVASPTLRALAKVATLATAVAVAAVGLRRSSGFGLHLLLFLASATMLLSYHRLYDLVLPLALLLAAGNEFLRLGRHGHAAVVGMFAVFLLAPESMVYRAGDLIGGALGGGGMVQLCAFRGFAHIFPLYPCMATALSFYALWLCVLERESLAFTVPSWWVKGESHNENP